MKSKIHYVIFILSVIVILLSMYSSLLMASNVSIKVYSERQPFLIQPLIDEYEKVSGNKIEWIYSKKGLVQKAILEKNNPTEVNALFNLALSFAKTLKENIRVTITAIKSINWLRSMIGVITPKFPDAADILIVSSPVPKTKKRNIIPKTPRAIHPIFVIFWRFISNYFFWAERISIKVIDASSISFTIESIFATI